ncbi:MAG: M1 family metallopeptidase [Lishizhenia sp.]
MIKRICCSLSLLLLFLGCSDTVSSTQKKDTHSQQSSHLTLQENGDSHTYSNLNEIRTEHLHLDLDINFDNKTIYGVARHKMNNSGTEQAIFDVAGLDIQKVTLGKEKEIQTEYTLGNEDPTHGAPLTIKVNRNTEFVNIYYKTTAKSNALDWLEPELTTGKKLPFLYTQGQAILTRTWIPVQDSPSNRITYSANVKVPSNLMAVMSASNPTSKNESGSYSFEMKQAIPCYLIALAVGDLSYASLGDNCGVYAEPELIEASKYEFEDLPKMIDAAEALYGAYQWEIYDIIVLPYSFPFGGMENPRLTFANPTLISGDRSSTSVIAHELAHSWSGNLVTNATWNDFWLNEGFTVYFENRIMEAIYGKKTADMLIHIEYQELENSIEAMMKENPKDTRLKLELSNRNPDDGMTDIAYVKGAFFLKTIEAAVGRSKFDEFLNKYFTEHAFQTLTTEDFIGYLNKHLLEKEKITFNTDEWIYGEGLPQNIAKVSADGFSKIQNLAVQFMDGKDISADLKRDNFIMQEWLGFIRKLDPSKLTPENLRTLDKMVDFKGWGNAEIMEEWFGLGIQVGYTDIIPEMDAFLCKVGRRKFLTPLYSKLAYSSHKELNIELGRKIYAKAKVNYHAVSKGTVEEILGL